MDFRALNTVERSRLWDALRMNSEGKGTLLMDSRDTSFVDVVDEIPDEEVVTAIKEVPTHY